MNEAKVVDFVRTKSEPTNCGRTESSEYCDVCLINDVEHSTDGYPDHTERCDCLCHKENVVDVKK